MPADNSTNQSVERAAAVLAAFLEHRQEMRVLDVAHAVGIGVSTTSRLLSTLESVSLVERDPVSGLYRLGAAAIALGGAAVNRHPVHRETRQTAQNLAHELGLGVNVAVRRGRELCYLLNFEGRPLERSFTLMGQHNPLHATGMGKALLCALDEPQRRELLGTDLTPYTDRTLVDLDALNADIDAAITRGYAREIEELALGRACLAAPIRGQGGQVLAALSISGPLSLLDLDSREEELAGHLIETVDAVSARLGYFGPASGMGVGLWDRVPT